MAGQNADIIVIFEDPYSDYVNYGGSGAWAPAAWEAGYAAQHFSAAGVRRQWFEPAVGVLLCRIVPERRLGVRHPDQRLGDAAEQRLSEQ